MLENLKTYIRHVGKPQWQRMLTHLAGLHEASIHPPFFRLPYRWEHIGTDAVGSAALGQLDTIHIALDTLPAEPQHALYQILNIIALQEHNGLIPGRITVVDSQLQWSRQMTSPPLWPLVIQAYLDKTGHDEVLPICEEALVRQIQWFETHRRSSDGFFYLDCLDRFWESGVEESVRFDSDGHEGHDTDELACVDASAHVYLLYDTAVTWSEKLHLDPTPWIERREALATYIQTHLFDEESGFFYDRWAILHPHMRRITFEGIWPMVVGAATSSQAHRVINDTLLDRRRLHAKHPLATVGQEEPSFEHRGWRGPSRNSITYWAAKGCRRYGRHDAAASLLEAALDHTALLFEATDIIWEFYPPHAGSPIPNHIGHNPLIAMATMWEKIKVKS